MPKLFDILSEGPDKEALETMRRKTQSRKPDSKSNRTQKNRTTKSRLALPNFVALDLETTGLDSKNDRVLEIGMVLFSKGESSKKFSTLINPQIDVPSYITELTGITTAEALSAPTFSEIAKQVLDFIGELPICGHHIEFDIQFLREELKRCGLNKISNRLIDSAVLARITLPNLKHFNLKAVADYLKVPLHNAHRALADAEASGGIAVALIPRLLDIDQTTRIKMANFAPGSFLKNLLQKSLNQKSSSKSSEILHPEQAEKFLEQAEEIKPIDIGIVKEVFSQSGKLSQLMQSYTPRKSQQLMAQEVCRALNESALLVAEAATGTGKSLAYLVPAAFMSCTNKIRIIISTYTKNLQDQLLTKDLPLVEKVVGANLSYCVLKGRGNYLCQKRWDMVIQGKLGNFSARERMALLPLIKWADQTQSGDIEEQNVFNPKRFGKIWNLISAQTYDCRSKRCIWYESCFLQRARRRALASNIVIINHALFYSDICSGLSFLGKIGPIIFDEAHQLVPCAYRYLRVEVDTNRVNIFIDLIVTTLQQIESALVPSALKELKAAIKRVREVCSSFLHDIAQWAALQAPQQQKFQFAYSSKPFESLTSVAEFPWALSDLREAFEKATSSLTTAALETSTEIEVAIKTAIESITQLKSDFIYLVSAITEDHVFWIEGDHENGWVKLCGVPLDIAELLAQVWSGIEGALIFTSATLSIENSFDYFKERSGIALAGKKISYGCYKSPFSASQAFRCAVVSHQTPDDKDYPGFVATCCAELLKKLGKNILVLFTATAMLEQVYEELKRDRSIPLKSILAQDISGQRQAILEQFKQSQGAILLGTDSFWEGIDAPAKECEIVVIPRLPFAVPSHPLTAALYQRAEKLFGESFFSFAVPEAIIKFRQGCGRLIRTCHDHGALIILDNRIVSKSYGKKFIDSLDGDFKIITDVNRLVEELKLFFDLKSLEEPSKSEILYVPFEQI